ncbi:energy transducer TonB [Sphingomonas sp. SUN039]|uniref:energy transducer TonB n=1 Tax=Sphingomonas sp. SUN039 TaxID=2937787 RepID=UPI0021641588|nr:energy transducer TonB [Sphingomonas sp. SUN039]UVO55148.1 TonB family protein [Sphingomonas sp. SUN039]
MHAPNTAGPGGYLDKKSRHPGLLAAAVVLHVGLLGTILSYHPELLVKPEDPMVLKKFPPIQQPPPPEPDKKTTKPQTKVDPKPQTEQPKVIVPTEPTGERWPEPPPQPPTDPGHGDGGTVKADPPPLPVLTGAGIDSRFARDLQPPYPPNLERMEVEGSVTVRVQIGPDGRVAAVELVRPDDPGFFASTRDWALKRWRFKPATRDGVAVASWLTKTVQFRIVRDR